MMPDASGVLHAPFFSDASAMATGIAMTELPKTFDPATLEQRWYAHWEANGLFRPDRPNAEQQRLYRLAWEQIEHNTALLRPGLTIRELAERTLPLPAKCLPNRYSVVLHGVGLCDEYPHATYAEDMEAFGYDARLEAGMTLCVESYMGEVGGAEGVKLEQQVLITDHGAEVLSTFPFEDALMPRQI